MVIVLAIYIITNFYILLYSKMNVLYYTGLFSVFLNPLFIYPLARSLNYLLFYLKKPYFINPRYRNSVLAYFQCIKVKQIPIS